MSVEREGPLVGRSEASFKEFKSTLCNGLARWLSGKESACSASRPGHNPCVGTIPWSRKWQPTPVFLPGESYGQKSLVGYSPWGHKETRRHTLSNIIYLPSNSKTTTTNAP